MRGCKERQVWSCWCSFLFIICVGILLWGEEVPAQARSVEEIKHTKEVRVCLPHTASGVAMVEPPDCRDNCTFRGSAYEISIAFAATLGNDITPKFLRVEWDQQFHNHEGKTVREASYTPELLASGTCDLSPIHLTKNPWRLKKLDFVILFPNRMMVIVQKATQTQFNTAADLGGKMAAVIKDTSFHTWLQEQNKSIYAANPVHIKLVGSGETLRAVEAGEVDFTILDSDMAIWSTRHQTKNAVAVFPVGPTDEIGWAFRKEDTDLQAAVQKFFDTQRADPDSALNQIWKKVFGLSLSKFIPLVTAIK